MYLNSKNALNRKHFIELSIYHKTIKKHKFNANKRVRTYIFIIKHMIKYIL